MKTQYVTRYWFAGMKKPAKLPKGCEWLGGLRWLKCRDGDPKDWSEHPRRWRVKVPTCKWSYSRAGELNVLSCAHKLEHDYQPTYCPTCGKRVEIVTKKTKGK